VRFIFRRYAELGSVRLLKDELEARSIRSKLRTNASGRISGGKPFARGALYLMLQNRIYRGEIVHNQQSYVGEHEPIIDQPLWDAVQAQLASNAAQHNDGGKTRPPSLLVGMLFDGDGNRMTPSHAVKKDTRYRYYVSRSLITKDRAETSAGLRIPAAEIEHLVSSRVHRWLLDPGSIYKSTSARLADASMQQRLVARAADLGKCWPQLPVARKRAVLAEIRRRPDFVGTSLAFSPPTSAALRYWNMARQRYCRRLARNGKPCASLPTQSPSQPRTPARKAGVLDLRNRMRERDGLSAGGRWIRTFGSPTDPLPFSRQQSRLP